MAPQHLQDLKRLITSALHGSPVSPTGANLISTNMGELCQSCYDTNDFLSLCFSNQAWTQSVLSRAAWFVLRFPLKWNMKCAGKQSSCHTHALVATVTAEGTVVSAVTGKL